MIEVATIKSVTNPLIAFEKIERTIEGCKHYEQLLPVMVMIDHYKKLFGDDSAVEILTMKLSRKGNELL